MIILSILLLAALAYMLDGTARVDGSDVVTIFLYALVELFLELGILFFLKELLS